MLISFSCISRKYLSSTNQTRYAENNMKGAKGTFVSFTIFLVKNKKLNIIDEDMKDK